MTFHNIKSLGLKIGEKLDPILCTIDTLLSSDTFSLFACANSNNGTIYVEFTLWMILWEKNYLDNRNKCEMFEVSHWNNWMNKSLFPVQSMENFHRHTFLLNSELFWAFYWTVKITNILCSLFRGRNNRMNPKKWVMKFAAIENLWKP